MAVRLSPAEAEAGADVASLKFLALRAAAQQLFRANSSAHKVRNGAKFMREYLRYLPVPKPMKALIGEGLGGAFREVQRWWDKHTELFPDGRKKTRKSGHLSLYFECLVWRRAELLIDDALTAHLVIADNPDWHLLQFQFAAAYAIEDILLSFDHIQLGVFKERLGDHPLYVFWFDALAKIEDGKISLMYNSEGLAPNQPVSLVFQWALNFGYQELANYLWEKVTPAQREYIGMLQWRRVCMQAKNKPTFKFLCRELCKLNPAAVKQITWQVFYSALSRVITEPGGVMGKELSLCRIKFLLFNSCDLLRDSLLRHANFRAAQLALQHKEVRLFSLLEIFMSDAMLKEARQSFESGLGGGLPRRPRTAPVDPRLT